MSILPETKLTNYLSNSALMRFQAGLFINLLMETLVAELAFGLQSLFDLLEIALRAKNLHFDQSRVRMTLDKAFHPATENPGQRFEIAP